MLPRHYGIETIARKKQINTLKVFNENVTEITEDYEYQVRFTANGVDFSINVILSRNFPNDKPVLNIYPPVLHPWVTSDGDITSAPGLLNFTIYSDLGRVVQAIIREFQRNPPPLLDGSTPLPQKVQDADAGRVSPIFHANYSGLNSYTPLNVPSTPQMQMQSVAFPELNTMSLSELEFLRDSEERRLEFVDNLPQVKEMNKCVDDLIKQIEEMVETNLSKEERLVLLKKGIDERIEEATKLAFENERLHSLYLNLSEKYAPKNIKEQLRIAAAEAECESEKIAENFLSGNLDVDNFVQLYLKKRTICQTRKTKEEKFSQQLNSLAKAGF